ncbi:uncharacterized protein LOC126672842 [Mercurialis annua]|uniref:uncharacterized protein LOC126672842 n=1 Tax=Mercurialis annua TaxID=3986 RepID=UPI0024AD2D34|nr:uncharacterized protein LOC126672842 [Mercurialis annua]
MVKLVVLVLKGRELILPANQIIVLVLYEFFSVLLYGWRKQKLCYFVCFIFEKGNSTALSNNIIYFKIAGALVLLVNLHTVKEFAADDQNIQLDQNVAFALILSLIENYGGFTAPTGTENYRLNNNDFAVAAASASFSTAAAVISAVEPVESIAADEEDGSLTYVFVILTNFLFVCCRLMAAKFTEHSKDGYDIGAALFAAIKLIWNNFEEISLSFLRVLELHEICFRRTVKVSAVLCLIVMSSTNLEKVVIEFVAARNEPISFFEEDFDEDQDLLDNKLLKVEDLVDIELKKRRVVKMVLPDTQEVEPELEFIEFLLAESVIRKKMFIQPDREIVAEEGLKILKDITQFERSSKKAKIGVRLFLNLDIICLEIPYSGAIPVPRKCLFIIRNLDRINDLAENIGENIFTCLPIRDAVRTRFVLERLPSFLNLLHHFIIDRLPTLCGSSSWGTGPDQDEYHSPNTFVPNFQTLLLRFSLTSYNNFTTHLKSEVCQKKKAAKRREKFKTMDSQSVKRIENSSTSDRIGNLPSHIIENILIYLPIHEAVRTSILSKNWRFKWRFLPKLVFDKTFYHKSVTPSTGKRSINKFFLNIFRVLLLHHGPILNFTFDVSRKTYPEIDQLMLYLSEKDVHEILLDFGDCGYRVPSFLFACATLRRLTVSMCLFTVPLVFQGFVSLISLTFKSVCFKTIEFETFISKCPLLERLSIKNCYHIDNLDVDIPYLKFFEFIGVFRCIHFRKPCHHLSVVIFDSPIYRVSGSAHFSSVPTKLLECLPAVEHLHLGYEFMEHPTVGAMSRKLSLGCLRVLELPNICFRITVELSAVLYLIAISSPNLEKLEIGFVAAKEDTNYLSNKLSKDDELLKLEDLVDNELKKLRVVKLKLPHRKEVKPEMKFIGFLLAESVVLEKMYIQPAKRTVAEEGLEILKEITQFERSSKKAKIIYLDP